MKRKTSNTEEFNEIQENNEISILTLLQRDLHHDSVLGFCRVTEAVIVSQISTDSTYTGAGAQRSGSA